MLQVNDVVFVSQGAVLGDCRSKVGLKFLVKINKRREAITNNKFLICGDNSGFVNAVTNIAFLVNRMVNTWLKKSAKIVAFYIWRRGCNESLICKKAERPFTFTGTLI